MTLPRRAAVVAVAATLLLVTRSAPSTAVDRGPLQAHEVIFLLERGVSPVRVRALVRRLGIGFQPAEDVLGVVKRAGGDAALLDALRAGAPPTPAAVPSPAAAIRPSPLHQPGAPLPFEPEMVPVRSGPKGDFWLSRYEITNQQYAVYIRQMGRPEPPAPYWPTTADLPIVNVTWHDANSYCRWLTLATGRHYRLPTEDEWEFAARGGRVGLTYPWGNGAPEGRACFGKGAPCRAGSFRATAFGLRDMVGSVAEWCADDREGGKTRAARGGDWTVSLQSAQEVSIARRERLDPDKRRNSLGFRVARDP